MPKEYQIKTFDNIIEIGTTLGMNWFRGHSKLFNNLDPGIFRPLYDSPMHEMFRPFPEIRLMSNFKRFAPSLISNLPEENDYLHWLLWIQHHGMPTRLLDWSENILIATFFAVVEHPKEDGELWTIYPDELNGKSEFFGLALPNHRKVRYLSGQPYHSDPEKLRDELELKEIPLNPIALMPNNIFPRMTAQMSVFTIHPDPKKSGQKIEEILLTDNEITRYVIPKGLKSEFEKKLSYLGINYRTLFPDLEGMAKFIAREERYFGWGQPDPPTFEE
jgi:FRG domain